MYTLILIWSLRSFSEGGTESLTIPNLSYQECSQQINNFTAGAKDLSLRYSQCVNQGDVKQ